ncbi:hypothetical protein EDC01DRAFT_635297 [Geopyxis carbonaria]|nr:hypothetical protein EDC01DRAFT_635297 [Geopyxis carbonaria]
MSANSNWQLQQAAVNPQWTGELLNDSEHEVENVVYDGEAATPDQASYNFQQAGPIDNIENAYYGEEDVISMPAPATLRFSQPAIDDPSNLENMIGQIPGSTRWTCTFCGYGSWKSKNEAKRHAASKHLIRIQCPLVENGHCNQAKGYTRSDHLQKHWTTKHALLPRELCRNALLALNRGNNAENSKIKWIDADPNPWQNERSKTPEGPPQTIPVVEAEYDEPYSNTNPVSANCFPQYDDFHGYQYPMDRSEDQVNEKESLPNFHRNPDVETDEFDTANFDTVDSGDFDQCLPRDGLEPQFDAPAYSQETHLGYEPSYDENSRRGAGQEEFVGHGNAFTEDWDEQE